MEPDKYQQAWRAQSSQTRVTVNADSLLNAVKRNHQINRVANVLGDLTDIGFPLLMLPVWIYIGVASAAPWTWYLMVPGDLWIIGFSLVVRARRKEPPNDPDELLLSNVKESLDLVEQQIRLDRNFVWRYLLPIAIPLLAFFAELAWRDPRGWSEFGPKLGCMLTVIAIAAGVYYLNQRVSRTQYEPQRDELLRLLASLKDETTSDATGEYPILMKATRIRYSGRRMLIGILCAVAIMLIVLAAIILRVRARSSVQTQSPEKSRFAAVRRQQAQLAEIKRDSLFPFVATTAFRDFGMLATAWRPIVQSAHRVSTHS